MLSVIKLDVIMLSVVALLKISVVLLTLSKCLTSRKSGTNVFAFLFKFKPINRVPGKQPWDKAQG
jgi:hypothetical protein